MRDSVSPAFSGPLEGPRTLAVGYGTGLDELVISLLDTVPGLQSLSFRTSYCVGVGCLFVTGGLPTSLPPLANGNVITFDDNSVFLINGFAGQVSVSVTSSSVDQIEEAVLELPVTDFQSPSGHPAAMISILRNIEAEIMAGSIEEAIQKLRNLRRRVDGCGSSPDRNDWVTNCGSQVEIRTLLGQLINNLSATP